jgi:hypothetical protein
MQRVRVPLFLPTRNGLHFLNAWPSEPDYTISVLGQTITLGDASNGLCGGMAYTVNDLFQTRLLPPADTTNSAEGTPLFTYIVARLTNSFDAPDVNQYQDPHRLPRAPDADPLPLDPAARRKIPSR